MSDDWFCKIEGKKVGPLTGQQLRTIVAKGKLRPEHLVRRGGEGPWVPAGRVKGLFPEKRPASPGDGKQAGPGGGKPAARRRRAASRLRVRRLRARPFLPLARPHSPPPAICPRSSCSVPAATRNIT